MLLAHPLISAALFKMQISPCKWRHSQRAQWKNTRVFFAFFRCSFFMNQTVAYDRAARSFALSAYLFFDVCYNNFMQKKSTHIETFPLISLKTSPPLATGGSCPTRWTPSRPGQCQTSMQSNTRYVLLRWHMQWLNEETVGCHSLPTSSSASAPGPAQAPDAALQRHPPGRRHPGLVLTPQMAFTPATGTCTRTFARQWRCH